MSTKYRTGDILEIKNVPESFRHVFITRVDETRYYLYFLSKPDQSYSYCFSEIENDDVSIKISR